MSLIDPQSALIPDWILGLVECPPNRLIRGSVNFIHWPFGGMLNRLSAMTRPMESNGQSGAGISANDQLPFNPLQKSPIERRGNWLNDQ